MPCKISIIVLIVSFLLAQFSYAEQLEKNITIELKEKVMINTATFTLADIANVVTQDPEIRKNLDKIVIGETPRVGYLDKVRRTDVIGYIEKHYPDLYRRVNWQGPKWVEIQSVGVAYDAENIIQTAEKAIKDRIEKEFNQDNSKVNIKFNGRIDDIYLPKGTVHLVPRMGTDKGIDKRMNVWVDILIGNNHYRSLPVWFDVEVMAPAMVTSKTLKKGNTLTINHIKENVVNFASVEGTPLKEIDIEQLGNVRLHKDINKGEVLTREAIETIPDVVKGNTISVIANVGGVVVNASAVALADGIKGDVIRVQKPGTDINYEAIVTGKNQVTAK